MTKFKKLLVLNIIVPNIIKVFSMETEKFAGAILTEQEDKKQTILEYLLNTNKDKIIILKEQQETLNIILKHIQKYPNELNNTIIENLAKIETINSNEYTSILNTIFISKNLKYDNNQLNFILYLIDGFNKDKLSGMQIQRTFIPVLNLMPLIDTNKLNNIIETHKESINDNKINNLIKDKHGENSGKLLIILKNNLEKHVEKKIENNEYESYNKFLITYSKEIK